jgi:hypothetical protein
MQENRMAQGFLDTIGCLLCDVMSCVGAPIRHHMEIARRFPRLRSRRKKISENGSWDRRSRRNRRAETESVAVIRACCCHVRPATRRPGAVAKPSRPLRLGHCGATTAPGPAPTNRGCGSNLELALEQIIDCLWVGLAAWRSHYLTDKVAQAKAKPTLIGWFVGQAMRASGGKANPQAVNDLLKRKLEVW